MRNVCTEGGMFAIRDGRDYVINEDLMKAARKIKETKKLESKMDYSKVWLSLKIRLINFCLSLLVKTLLLINI